MLFNSLPFLAFLPIVYLAYRLAGAGARGGVRLQNALLLVASYVFYGWWDARFLFLIALSTTVDFCCGLMVDRGRVTGAQWRRAVGWTLGAALLFVVPRWSGEASQFDGLLGLGGSPGWLLVVALVLVAALCQALYHFHWRHMSAERKARYFVRLSVVVNLGLLGFFKYFNFFADSAEVALASMGFDAASWRLDIVLPVGISFYTFQTMSYTLDIRRGTLKATDRLLEFALFVSYFPQLVAGPIERASALLPRILNPRSHSYDQAMRGLNLILIGFFKKVAIADSVAVTVDSVFLSTGQASWIDVVVATLMFTAQIYCDFSGYSDIARGVSKLFGIDLMTNFDQPYFSLNPSEFWRRWHISLSSWLRDYLYISLGGNRGGLHKTYRNLALTMLLGGLWHGAAWNFVLWGAYHGAILCVHRWFTSGRESAPATRVRKGVTMLGFFMITCYGWLLFRAVSLEQVVTYTWTLVSDFGNLAAHFKRPTLAGLIGLPVLVVLEFTQYFSDGNPHYYRRYPPVIRGAIYAVLIFAILLGMSNAQAQFIYFQF